MTIDAPPRLAPMKLGIVGLGYVGLPLAVAFAGAAGQTTTPASSG